MNKFIKELDDANEKIEALKNAILCSVVVRVRNANDDVVWCCADDIWRDKRFKNFTVEQEINMSEILKNLKNAFF